MIVNSLLSVIIPVYNVQDYLAECLDSIVNQTYSNLEIICVNDGSTDNSLEILTKYAAKDSRIILIDKENGGSSTARNMALEIASGDYITFMDSDDVIRLNTYEKNLKYLENSDIDFVQYPILWDWTGPNERKSNYIKTMIEGSDSIFKFYWDGILTFSFCDKIFKRKVIIDARFPVGQVFEDQYLAPTIVKNYTKCMISTEGEYLYRHREYSNTRGTWLFKKSFDYLRANIEIYKVANKNALISRDSSSYFLLNNIYWFLVHFMRDFSMEQRDLSINYVKPYPIRFPDFISSIFSSRFSSKDKYHLTLLYCLGLRNTHKLFSYIENRKK